MKKRLISMLLTVLMVASLFGGMSVSAYADEEYETVEYTLKSGDTLLKVCNKLGLNWYSCQNAINKLNNISEAQYRKLSVGQVITLPASNEDAVKITKATISSGSSTGSTGTVISGGTGSSTGSVSGVNAAYWLIPYTMQKGETVAGVCNTLGISFATYSEQIKTINNISTWSKVAAGKTLLLPSASAPAAGTSCYGVVAHQIQKGETAYSICNQYGISYNANISLLQTLNKGTSLTNIKYGKTLFVPVATVASSGSSTGSGSSSSGSGSSTGSGSSSSGSGSSSSGSGSSTTKTYKLSSGTVTNGKISFSVNGKTVTSAAAGSTVTIVASPNSMCGLKSVSLKYADGSAVPKVTDSTFTMPECDVVVNATFEKGFYMGVIFKDGKGSATLYNENGVATTTAAKGAEITVKAKADAGYTIEKIYVVKNDGTGASVKDNMKSGDSFTMPDCRVFVYVQCKATATYGLKTEIVNGLYGSAKLKVNGSEVTRAAAGATVEVACSPSTGYTAKDEDITVTGAGGTIKVTEGKFIMPAFDVTVSVKFTPSTEAVKYSIVTKPDANGWGTVEADVEEAEAGKKVTLTPLPKDGYEIDHYIVKGSYGENKVEKSVGYFNMPDSDVTVTPVFVAKTNTVTINPGINGKISINGSYGPVNVETDQVVKVVSEAEEGYYLSTFTVTFNGVDTVYKYAQGEKEFRMPAGNVTVTPEFKAKSFELKVNVSSAVAAQTKVQIGTGEEKTLSDAGTTLKVKTGEVVVFTYTPDAGYLIVKDAGGEKTVTDISGSGTKTVSVTMPNGNASITIE